MENLLYLTLELSDGRYIEQIVLADKKDEAAESMVADNKWRYPIGMYMHQVDISISGILVKGQYIGRYRIQQWL